MKKDKKTICILGGMGPQASAKMVEVLINMAASKFGVKNCEDFPEIILFSLPVPDFIAGQENLSQALAMLKEKIKIMNNMNVTLAAMACNTAHMMLNELQSISRVPFLSMIDLVAEAVGRQKLNKVGVLAGPNTIKSGLFKRALQKRRIAIVVPDEKQENEIEEIIRKVIAGKAGDKDSQRLVVIAKAMEGCGAEGIILGCTELPLIFPMTFSLPVFDSIKITAEALLLRCFNSETKTVKIKERLFL